VHRRAVPRISATRASQTYAAAVSPLFSSARPATPAMRVEPSSGALLLAIQFHRSSCGGFPRNWLRHFGTPFTHPAEAPHTPILEAENRCRQAQLLAQPCGEVRELEERSFECAPSGTRDGWIAPLLCPQVSAVDVVPMAALVEPVRVLRKATLDRVLIARRRASEPRCRRFASSPPQTAQEPGYHRIPRSRLSQTQLVRRDSYRSELLNAWRYGLAHPRWVSVCLVRVTPTHRGDTGAREECIGQWSWRWGEAVRMLA
jgi:hypothetical protein